MAYDLQEQESIDQMKAWWEKWGTPVTAAVCVVCLGFAAFNGWKWYERNQAAKAMVAYSQLQAAVLAKDAKNITSLSSGLMENYSGTIYAPMAALAAAQSALANGDFKTAEYRLNWVIEKGGHPEYDTIARVRLAGVYFDEGRLDEGLQVLAAAKPEPRQKPLVLDREADIYAAKGDAAAARERWQQILDGAAEYPNDPILRIVEYKLGSLPTV